MLTRGGQYLQLRHALQATEFSARLFTLGFLRTYTCYSL